LKASPLPLLNRIVDNPERGESTDRTNFCLVRPDRVRFCIETIRKVKRSAGWTRQSRTSRRSSTDIAGDKANSRISERSLRACSDAAGLAAHNLFSATFIAGLDPDATFNEQVRVILHAFFDVAP
jgi:hypothetical protein